MTPRLQRQQQQQHGRPKPVRPNEARRAVGELRGADEAEGEDRDRSEDSLSQEAAGMEDKPNPDQEPRGKWMVQGDGIRGNPSRQEK